MFGSSFAALRTIRDPVSSDWCSGSEQWTVTQAFAPAGAVEAGQFAGRFGVRRDDDGVGRSSPGVGFDSGIAGLDRRDRHVGFDRRAGRFGAFAELVRDRTHTIGGDHSRTVREGLERVLEDRRRRAQRPVERDPAVEGRREALDERRGEPPVGEVLLNRQPGVVFEEIRPADVVELALQLKEPEFVRGPDVAVQQRGKRRTGGGERIRERRAVVRSGDRRPGGERPEIERVVVELPAGGRVGGEEHLKSPIERVPVDDARTDPTADARFGLEQFNICTRFGEVARGDQPSQAASRDDDVHGTASGGSDKQVSVSAADGSRRTGLCRRRANAPI